MKHIKMLSELHRVNGWEAPDTPQLSVIGCQQSCPLGDRQFTVDAYLVAFKKLKSGVIMYGRTPDHHTSGYMYFMKPRHIIQLKDLHFEEAGFMIFIHEDYLNGHDLFQTLKHFGFFDYEVNEALHLSAKKEAAIRDLQERITTEYFNNPDEYSRNIMLGHVASILMYAQRFYKRQYINRTQLSGKTVTRFNEALQIYLRDQPSNHG